MGPLRDTGSYRVIGSQEAGVQNLLPLDLPSKQLLPRFHMPEGPFRFAFLSAWWPETRQKERIF